MLNGKSVEYQHGFVLSASSRLRMIKHLFESQPMVRLFGITRDVDIRWLR